MANVLNITVGWWYVLVIHIWDVSGCSNHDKIPIFDVVWVSLSLSATFVHGNMASNVCVLNIHKNISLLCMRDHYEHYVWVVFWCTILVLQPNWGRSTLSFLYASNLVSLKWTGTKIAFWWFDMDDQGKIWSKRFFLCKLSYLSCYFWIIPWFLQKHYDVWLLWLDR